MPDGYILHIAGAEALFVQAGISYNLDEACLSPGSPDSAEAFIKACRSLRYWPRELTVDLGADPAA